MIVVKYFGALVEKTKCHGEKIYFSNLTLTRLLEELVRKYELSQLSFSVAINQKIVSNTNNQVLKSNDIVALLPPFAGG